MWMPTQLSRLIDPIAREAVGKDWALFAGLLQNWQEIVGKSYAVSTAPVKITFPHQPQKAKREGGTLTIRLPKGLAMSFTYDVPTILQRVNGYFGYAAISKITLDPVQRLPSSAPVKPLPTKEMTELAATEAADIEDSDLREALSSLGARIIMEDKS